MLFWLKHKKTYKHKHNTHIDASIYDPFSGGGGIFITKNETADARCFCSIEAYISNPSLIRSKSHLYTIHPYIPHVQDVLVYKWALEWTGTAVDLSKWFYISFDLEIWPFLHKKMYQNFDRKSSENEDSFEQEDAMKFHIEVRFALIPIHIHTSVASC